MMKALCPKADPDYPSPRRGAGRSGMALRPVIPRPVRPPSGAAASPARVYAGTCSARCRSLLRHWKGWRTITRAKSVSRGFSRGNRAIHAIGLATPYDERTGRFWENSATAVDQVCQAAAGLPPAVRGRPVCRAKIAKWRQSLRLFFFEKKCLTSLKAGPRMLDNFSSLFGLGAFSGEEKVQPRPGGSASCRSGFNPDPVRGPQTPQNRRGPCPFCPTREFFTLAGT